MDQWPCVISWEFYWFRKELWPTYKADQLTSLAKLQGWPTVGNIQDTHLANLWISGHV